jgi:N utilization substance protein B
MASRRRKARIAALQALFESDSSRHDPEVALTWLTDEEELPEPTLAYAKELIAGVIQNRDQIDEVIEAHAPSWPLGQVSVVDRNILRLAIFEIMIENKVPLKAAINEAVELAKIFGSYNSFKFVNGVLGAISQIQVSGR